MVTCRICSRESGLVRGSLYLLHRADVCLHSAEYSLFFWHTKRCFPVLIEVEMEVFSVLLAAARDKCRKAVGGYRKAEKLQLKGSRRGSFLVVCSFLDAW